jgi:hypothetical protein
MWIAAWQGQGSHGPGKSAHDSREEAEAVVAAKRKAGVMFAEVYEIEEGTA